MNEEEKDAKLHRELKSLPLRKAPETLLQRLLADPSGWMKSAPARVGAPQAKADSIIAPAAALLFLKRHPVLAVSGGVVMVSALVFVPFISRDASESSMNQPSLEAPESAATGRSVVFNSLTPPVENVPGQRLSLLQVIRRALSLRGGGSESVASFHAPANGGVRPFDPDALKARGAKDFNRLAGAKFPGPTRNAGSGGSNPVSGSVAATPGMIRAQSSAFASNKGGVAAGGRAFSDNKIAGSGSGGGASGGSQVPVYGAGPGEGVGGGLLSPGAPIGIAEPSVPASGGGQAANAVAKAAYQPTPTGGTATVPAGGAGSSGGTTTSAPSDSTAYGCPANTVDALSRSGSRSPAAPGSNLSRIPVKVDGGSSQVTVLPFVMGDKFTASTYEAPGGGGPKVIMVSDEPCGQPVTSYAYWPRAVDLMTGQSKEYLASLNPAARAQALQATPLVLDAGKTYYLVIYQGTEDSIPATADARATTLKSMVCAAPSTSNCNFGINWQSSAGSAPSVQGH
ncbi:MAG: hypothetical protein ACHQ51_11845 [Elusimicrobiota bacterium]